MKNKKQTIAVGLLLILMIGFSLAYYFGIPGLGNGDIIYVEKVADIVALGSGNGGQNRYAGIVESQAEWNISENIDKTVKEIYVEEGDTVNVGDKLFSYDNEEAELALAQAKLELERMENEIKAGEAEIKSLEQEKKYVSSSDQIEYTIQIQSQKALNKKTEYEIKSQKAEIESLEKAAKNSVVKSEMAGVVKKINKASLSAGSEYEEYEYTDGDDSVFMTILATGDYRIKASVNEQNQWTIEAGTPVIVRSRVDENVKWTGRISNVDTENPDMESSEYMEYSDDMSISSQYPFYVDLDSCEGLILGQHVYVEPDEGQDEIKEGLWLDSYYIVQEETGEVNEEDDTIMVKSYVWVENSMSRLEKREVVLGTYDAILDKYQIVEGLTVEEYIAFPDENYKEGTKTTRNIDEAVTEALEEETGEEDSTWEDYDESYDFEDGDTFQEFEWEEDFEEDVPIINEDGTVGSLDDSLEVLA